MQFMQAVGIRELKNKLSHYVRLVEAGESVLVTDRGTVVAELCPPGKTTQPPKEADLPPGLAELVRKGLAKPGLPHDPGIYVAQPKIVPDGTAAELLDWVRGDR